MDNMKKYLHGRIDYLDGLLEKYSKQIGKSHKGPREILLKKDASKVSARRYEIGLVLIHLGESVKPGKPLMYINYEK